MSDLWIQQMIRVLRLRHKTYQLLSGYARFSECGMVSLRRWPPGLRARARRHADDVNVPRMVKPLLEHWGETLAVLWLPQLMGS
jgi:hypothetical protein